MDPQSTMWYNDFKECLVIPLQFDIQENPIGSVMLDGSPLKFSLGKSTYYDHTRDMFFDNVQTLSIHIAGIIREAGTKILRVENFSCSEGELDPIEIEIIAVDESENVAKYSKYEGVALQAAEEGIVLLKNSENVLPLKDKKWNLFGHDVNVFRSYICGAGKINPTRYVNLIKAIKGADGYSFNEELNQHYLIEKTEPNEQILENAKKYADNAIMVISRFATEAWDEAPLEKEYYLTAEEKNTIKYIAENYEKTIVIINTPYPIDVSYLLEQNIKSILYVGIGGMFGGLATFNVLTGKVCPSGKTTDTWALDYYDIPASANFLYADKNGERFNGDADAWVNMYYEEDIYVGYRYFSTFNKPVAFCFGYGLSYTKFDISSKVCLDNETAKISLNVKNIGDVSGKEVVQVYVKKPDGKTEKPNRELCAFEKTNELAPNEAEEIVITVPISKLNCYDEESASYYLEQGTYEFYVGNSLESAKKCGEFTLNNTQVVKQVKNRLVPQVALRRLSKHNEKEFRLGESSSIFKASGWDEERQFTAIGPEKYPTDQLWEEVCSFSSDELCRLLLGNNEYKNRANIGFATEISDLDGRDIPKLICADGNSGVNVSLPNIGFPTGVILCSTFNKELMQVVGGVIGEIAKDLKINLILAPALNLHRNPLGGRNAEYFSEDPYLAGVMAGNYCKGLEATGVGGCYKHCIANNSETLRKRNQSIVSERAVRELYFRAFEWAMDVYMPKSIMTGYNSINGAFCCNHQELLTGMFREEFHFDGFIMSDWGCYSYETLDLAPMIRAGIDFMTPGGKDCKQVDALKELYAKKEITLSQLRLCVYRLLKTAKEIESKVNIRVQ